MSAVSEQSPFELLQEIEQRSKGQLKGFPVQEEVKTEWLGVAFQVRSHTLLAPMTEVSEVFSPPNLAPVPGVKSWLLGIANMRGNLLPVIDLEGFLYGNNLARDFGTQRIIAVENAGLKVSAILGLKRFWVDEQVETAPLLDRELQPFVDSAFRREAAHYGVFNISKLVGSELFLDVAV